MDTVGVDDDVVLTTVTVNVDVEESTVDGQEEDMQDIEDTEDMDGVHHRHHRESVDNDDMSEGNDFGVAGDPNARLPMTSPSPNVVGSGSGSRPGSGSGSGLSRTASGSGSGSRSGRRGGPESDSMNGHSSNNLRGGDHEGDGEGEDAYDEHEPGSGSKPLVSARLMQTTNARINSARALEEARGRVKHEDDIWWDQRGSKAYNIPRGNINKSLAHVTSKLHVATAATIFGQRDKANLEKVRPKPLPKPNPEATNPYKDATSKFLTQTTKAAQLGEWKTWKEKQREEELRLAEELAIKSAECKKVAQTSEKLLQTQDFKKVRKVKKDVDKREEGWKRISITDHSLSTSPRKSLLNEGLNGRGSPVQSPDKALPHSPKSLSGRSVASASGSKMNASSMSLSHPHSYEIWTQQMPAYKVYVPPPRPKSPTPCAFGSGSARSTTPTETRGRANTPTHTSTERSSSLGSTSTRGRDTDRSGGRGRSNSPNRTATAAHGSHSGVSRAAEARQRARNSVTNTPTHSVGPGFNDRSSPATPFDKIMPQNGSTPTTTTPGSQSNPFDSTAVLPDNVGATPNSNSNNINSATNSIGTPIAKSIKTSSAGQTQDDDALHEMY
jgi:hypothetical protein